jgi:hypothetical protein
MALRGTLGSIDSRKHVSAGPVPQRDLSRQWSVCISSKLGPRLARSWFRSVDRLTEASSVNSSFRVARTEWLQEPKSCSCLHTMPAKSERIDPFGVVSITPITHCGRQSVAIRLADNTSAQHRNHRVWWRNSMSELSAKLPALLAAAALIFAIGIPWRAARVGFAW